MSEKRLRVIISANFFAAEVRNSLMLYLNEIDICADLEFVTYDLIIPQMLDPAGILFTADIVVLLVQIEMCAGIDFVTASCVENEPFENLLRAIEAGISQRGFPRIGIIICPHSLEFRYNSHISIIENKLCKQLGNLPGIDIITTNEIESRYPARDYLQYFVGDNPLPTETAYSQLSLAIFGELIARYVYRHFREPRKVIVADCDDTLWLGQCAELGPTGVSIGVGNRALQEILLRQSERGQLICLCSKNNEPDVQAVFNQHPEMVLRREHLTACRINWESKASNLRSLSDELHLALDSFLFLDDDVFQCESVRAILPEVKVIHIPADQAELSRLLIRVWDFDYIASTSEDLARSNYYKQNALRDQARESMLTLEEFLSTLDLKVEIYQLRLEDIARASQLTQRVNQFNLNGIRRSVRDIEQIMANTDTNCCAVNAADRFGNYGMVGLMIYDRSSAELNVRGLLLSCRALGKGVEHHLAIYIAKQACSSGAPRVVFSLQSTAKNRPLQMFLTQLGVELVESRATIATERLLGCLGMSECSSPMAGFKGTFERESSRIDIPRLRLENFQT